MSLAYPNAYSATGRTARAIGPDSRPFAAPNAAAQKMLPEP
jgi:hypothetical protein